MTLQKFNISEWVEADRKQTAFRQAVHTVLTAISGTPDLQASMVMKGGVLLALAYESPRFTGDIDFSTSLLLAEFNIGSFRKMLDGALVNAVETLGYGLDCRIQKLEQQPSRSDAMFPTIRANIGYAYKGDAKTHKRLMMGNSTMVVGLDYSLNEPMGNIDLIELSEGKTLRIYDTVELIAEKFRALLQQAARNRVRRQDIYDLHYVLTTHPVLVNNPHTKKQILQRLIEKSAARNLSVNIESMANDEIKRRAHEEYHLLAAEIEGELPLFENVYAAVESFYRSLPW